MTDGERSLWRAYKDRRDGEAFERLVRPHLRFLEDFARRAGCDAEADDAVQAALVELAEARGDRPLKVPLRAWLGRSVLQHARRQRRARGRRLRHEAEAARPERVDEKPSAHDEVERALARLDPDARLAVELRYLHDLDYREIALILRASELACRLRVHRAIARLRRELGILAPAMIAALPLLAGTADARAAIARNAAASAGTVLFMATKLKIAGVALLALAALLLWRKPAAEPSRATRDEARAAPAGPLSAETPAPVAAKGEGAGGAGRAGDDATEPPIAPGKGCVRGTIRFEDGEPLKGARVSLWGETDVFAMTDGDGRFHIHDDWVGERAVYLAGPQGFRGVDSYAFLLEKVRMVADQSVKVEIVLRRGSRVASRVVSAVTGDPIADARIELRRPAGGQGEAGFTRTDREGRFAFDHVVPDDHSVAILAPGFEAQYTRVDLRERALPDPFRLMPARRLEIRIRNAPPAAVGMKAGWALARVGETLMIDGGATLDETGLLVGDAPPPGKYQLILWGTRHLPRVERWVECGTAAVESLEIPLEPGGRVEGVVRWPDGTPVAGARVRASTPEGGPFTTDRTGPLSAPTDGEGRFAFDWLPGAVAGASKEFTVTLDDADVPLGARTFAPGDPLLADLALPGSGAVRFELKGLEADRYGEIEILRAGEDVPVSERRLDGAPKGPIVLRGLPPGPLRLRVWQLGGSYLWRDLRVDGETQDLGILELPKWPRPAIQVRVPAGKDLPDWVFVCDRDEGASNVTERVQLDKEGRGVLPPQAPGHRSISVRGPYGFPVNVEFDVDPTRPPLVEVTIDP